MQAERTGKWPERNFCCAQDAPKDWGAETKITMAAAHANSLSHLRFKGRTPFKDTAQEGLCRAF
jgi:hypothetical protein